MTSIDVSDLKPGGLPQQDFPAPRAAEFRAFLSANVHQGIWRHAEENLSVEVCGVLVGRWAVDADGPYAYVSEFIRCDGATQKFAEVTFTHDSWNQINKEMDTKYQDLRVVGWYHTHPNFGIFLSDRDNFIHQHFFSEPGHIALVVDPVRKIEGIFIWRRGKTAALSHYWVGDRILSGAPLSADRVEHAPDSAGQSATKAATSASRESSIPWMMLGLLGVCLFQLGYMLSGLLSNWQQAALQQGAVAHYGIWKGYKPNFEERIATLALNQERIRQFVKQLSEMPPTADEKIAQEVKKKWAEVDRAMSVLVQDTVFIARDYGLNEVEKQEMLRLTTEKYTTKPSPSGTASATPGATPTASPSPTATAVAAPTATPTATPAPLPTVAAPTPVAATPTPPAATATPAAGPPKP